MRYQSELGNTPRLVHKQLHTAHGHHVTVCQLSTTTGLDLAVHLDAALGEQQLDVRTELDHVGQFQELAEPYRLLRCGRRPHLAYALIVSGFQP